MIDTTPLHEVTFSVKRRLGKGKHAPAHTVTVDLAEATDEEFQEWAIGQARGRFIDTRLGYRLAVVRALCPDRESAVQ